MNNIFNLSTFLKFLGKNKTYTAINIFGLAVSLMFVILIAVYTVQELSVDSFQEKADRIYWVTSEKGYGGTYKLADLLLERYPEIEKVCPMVNSQKNYPVNIADKKISADIKYVERTFFDVFSFQLKTGDREHVLDARNDAVISETFARKAFPDTDPVGKTIWVNDSLSVTVTGVMKDIKNSSIPYADILVRIENIVYYNSGLASETFDNAGETPMFILVKKGADIRTKAEDIQNYFKEIFWLYKNGNVQNVLFIPLKEIYFSNLNPEMKALYNGRIVQQGDRTFVMILMSVGLLILIFALINYINLTVAQTGFRAKEMAMRRLLGSDKSESFFRLIMESVLLSFISFAAGLLLAFTFESYAGNLLKTHLDIAGTISPFMAAASIGTVILLGVIAGILPAVAISGAKPIDVVKGSFRLKVRMTFSKFFITFQNAITIALITASITVVAQVEHLIKAPMGYHTENIIDIDMNPLVGEGSYVDMALLLSNELEQLPVVKRTAFGAGTPFNGGNNNTMNQEGKNISFQILICDSAYFDMLGFQKLRENHVSGEAYYLNEQALLELEIKEDALTFLYFGRTTPIAGIIKDFQLRNITAKASPVMVMISKRGDFGPWNLLVEVQGDPVAAYHAVQKVVERITHVDFNGKFIDDQVAESFAAQKRMATIIILFSVIAVVISLLGLLAMSTYFIRQRTKEIALRKVHGAENLRVLSDLVRVFLGYVVIAFIIAAPIIGYFMQQWLNDYSYRISLSPWIFIAAGGFCLLVSFVTVYWQSRIAANANPVRALKSE
jgi:putative ABC transport system permease protein